MKAKTNEQKPSPEMLKIARKVVAKQKLTAEEEKKFNNHCALLGARMALEDFVANATRIVDGLIVPQCLRYACPNQHSDMLLPSEHFLPAQSIKCPQCGSPMTRTTELTDTQLEVLTAQSPEDRLIRKRAQQVGAEHLLSLRSAGADDAQG